MFFRMIKTKTYFCCLDYAPGAPPFLDNLDDIEPDVPIVMGSVGAGAGGGRPTLKDYLDMMKANKMPLPGKASEGNIDNLGSSVEYPEVIEIIQR